jgi:hypothetical protein
MKELQKKTKKSAHHLLQWPLLLGKKRIVPEWKLRAYPQIAFPPFVKGSCEKIKIATKK